MAESQLLTATAVMQAATDGNAPEVRRAARPVMHEAAQALG